MLLWFYRFWRKLLDLLIGCRWSFYVKFINKQKMKHRAEPTHPIIYSTYPAFHNLYIHLKNLNISGGWLESYKTLTKIQHLASFRRMSWNVTFAKFISCIRGSMNKSLKNISLIIGIYSQMFNIWEYIPNGHLLEFGNISLILLVFLR